MKDQKINILFIIAEVSGYGAGRSMLNNIVYLKKLNINPYVLIPRDGLLTEYFKENDIPYIITNFKFWFKGYKWAGGPLIKRYVKDTYNYIKILWIIYRLRKHKFDIVHTGDVCTDIGIKLAKVLGAKHVMHIRAILKEQFGIEFEKGDSKSLCYVNNNSSFVVCNSWQAYNKYKVYMDPNKIKMIFSGIYSRELKNINTYKNNGNLKLLMVGRYEEGKGQMVALVALKILKDKGFNLTLDFYGDGPLKNSMNEYIIENKLKDYANVYGYDKDVFSKMANYDAGLMCSRIEGPARVLSEYMVNGLPVIASASGAMLELIQDSFNGYLFTPFDHEELALKIENLLLNPKRAEELGKNAYSSLSDNFSTEKTSEELLVLYNACLDTN